MDSRLERLQPALHIIHDSLNTVRASWLVGGSTGLLMHGIRLDADPRDLDLYADRAEIRHLAAALHDYATDEPHDSVTGMYRSNLSHYRICDIAVELVGSLEVDRGTARYMVETAGLMERFALPFKMGSIVIRVMPLVHELVFNVLRERPDRYTTIANKIRTDLELDAHRQLWEELRRRNPIGEPFLGQIRAHLPELVQEG